MVAILYSEEEDSCAVFTQPDEVSQSIARNILDFVRHEVKKERIPPLLPWQSGVGDVANAVLNGFMEDDNYQELYRTAPRQRRLQPLR